MRVGRIKEKHEVASTLVYLLSVEDRHKSLLREYEEANRYSMNLNTLNWQLGSILIGGSLAAVAASLIVISQSSQPNVILFPAFVASAAIIALISWLFFIKRNGDFAEIAINRMVEIEIELGLTFQQKIQQARQYGYTVVAGKHLRLSGPRGFRTALFLVLGMVFFLSLLIAYTIHIW